MFSTRPERTPESFYEDFYRTSQYPRDFIVRTFLFIEKNFGGMGYLIPTDSLKEIEDYFLPIDTDFDYLLTALGGEVDRQELSDEEFFALFADLQTVDDVISLLSTAWLIEKSPVLFSDST